LGEKEVTDEVDGGTGLSKVVGGFGGPLYLLGFGTFWLKLST
jgi:hypothetical protein